jgi:two-component system sensor histidine kinase MprB
MTFSARVALLTAAAVVVAAIGASILMYFVVQTQLLGQFDTTLVGAANTAINSVGRSRTDPDRPQFPGGPVATLTGRADVAAQIINANTGTVVRAQTDPVVALVTPDAAAVASGTKDAYFFETSIEGSHLRVYVAPLTRGTAVEVWAPLNSIDSALAETRVRLGLVALGGALLAAALGVVVARTALQPVRKLTNIVEEVARTRDLSQRVSTGSNDELGRLAASFNVMLGELETSLRSQRQLVADASHELRTPLTSLRTNLELLARGQPTDPAERQQVLNDLVGQMERLSTLVSDLIDLARDEKTQLVTEDVHLDDIANEAIAEMRMRYPNVRFDLQATPSVVHGVRSRIFRAITNLLDNAGKWSPPGGVVEVTVRGPEVTVRDHGPGIAPGDEARVFDRFWRSEDARQRPGSGLGLAIVKDVAETHGGRVTVERPSGGGAFFRLRLSSATATANS